MGDLDALAASMKKLGLLHPIGISLIDGQQSPENYRGKCNLVFGARRLEAARMLGWSSITARVIRADMLLAERDENEVRKDFTPSERVAIADEIARQIGNRQGQRTDIKAADPGIGLMANWPQVSPSDDELEAMNIANFRMKTRDVAAKAAGFGSTTSYRRAKEVVESGDDSIIADMDAGKLSIDAAHNIARFRQQANTDPTKITLGEALGKDLPAGSIEQRFWSIGEKFDKLAGAIEYHAFHTERTIDAFAALNQRNPSLKQRDVEIVAKFCHFYLARVELKEVYEDEG
jgi:Predicted transcriptional regulators